MSLEVSADVIAKALDRIADALFQQAKAIRESNKNTQRQATCAEEIVEMQRATLGVTAKLEQALEAQSIAVADAANRLEQPSTQPTLVANE